MSATVGGLVIVPILVLQIQIRLPKWRKEGEEVFWAHRRETLSSKQNQTPFLKPILLGPSLERRVLGPLAGPIHEIEAGSSNGGPVAPSSSKLQCSGSFANEVMPIVHSQESSKLKGPSVFVRRKARS